MPDNAHQSVWRSLPNGWGFRWQNIHPGHVHLLCQMDMDSSRQIYQEARKMEVMWSFHAFTIWWICHDESMSIWHSRWTWNRQGRFTKRQRRWKSCGHSMPLPSGEFAKTYQHRVVVSVSEPKLTSDYVKSEFRHELTRGDRDMYLPLDQRGWNSKNPPSSIQSRWTLKSIDLNILVDLHM